MRTIVIVSARQEPDWLSDNDNLPSRERVSLDGDAYDV